MDKRLNFNYATTHAFYWMLYATICSFASVQLLACGFSNSHIGLVFAISNILALILQPLFGDLADRSHKVTLTGLMQILNLVMIAMFAVLFLMKGKTLGLFILYVSLIALHTILNPLITALCFQLERRGAGMNFGLCRCAGSLAYSALCVFLGDLVEDHGIVTLRISNVLIGLCLLASFLLIGRQMKRMSSRADGRDREQVKDEITLKDFVLRHKMLMIMSMGLFFMYIHNQMLNNFMLQIVTHIGGDEGDMGRYFSFMAVMEIPSMVAFHWVNKRIRTAALVKFASFCFLLKMASIWLAPNVPLLLMTNLLQTFSFGLFTPAIVKYIDERMSPGEAVKGQTLYTSMITASSIVASILGGVILDTAGAGALTFISTLLTAGGVIVIFLTIDKVKVEA